MKGFPPNHVFLGTPVESITNDDDGRVRLHLDDDKSQVYDHVIIATHGDQAYHLIAREADFEEREVMSGFKTNKTTAILHNDLSLMPLNRHIWSSWNYITECSEYSRDVDQVCLTYNMNNLQHIPQDTFGDVFVTLNPLHLPSPDKVQGRYSYHHLLYNSSSFRSQNLLSRIQNTRGISYCGAWTKYGFHQDGLSSGLKVAQDHLGATLPFNLRDSTFSGGKRPRLSLLDVILRLVISVLQYLIVMLEQVMDIERERIGSRTLRRKKIA